VAGAFADGAATSARFSLAQGGSIAAHPSGNILLADRANHRIRLLSPSGFVSTLTGTGTPGFLDGAAGSALFNSPTGVALNATMGSGGVVFVADTLNSRIRAISLGTGAVTTLAGAISCCTYAEGVGTVASFYYPEGIAMMPGGATLVVSDTSNHRLRFVSTATGATSLCAGSGTPAYQDGAAGLARFNFPRGVAVDGSGASGTAPPIYVADTSNSRIRVVFGGMVNSLVGNGVSGFVDAAVGALAQVSSPWALTYDASVPRLLLGDRLNNRVRTIALDGSGATTTLLGRGVAASIDGYGPAAGFNQPVGIAIDVSGAALVSDAGTHVVRRVTCPASPSPSPGSSPSTSQSGSPAPTPPPAGCALVLTAGTQAATGFMEGVGVGASLFNVITGFNGVGGAAVNPATGDLVVADAGNNRIRVVSSAGVTSTLAGTGAAGFLDSMVAGFAVAFNSPAALAITNSSDPVAFVADSNNHRIRRVALANGTTTTVAGLGSASWGDGPALFASLYSPRGVAFDDAAGVLYVGDTFNHRIRVLTPGRVPRHPCGQRLPSVGRRRGHLRVLFFPARGHP